MQFQRDYGLPPTGTVDARTARALQQPPAQAGLQPVAAGDLRARIVSVAASQIGQGETPPHSNCTIYGPCEAWCADFATWVWRQAGVPAIGRIAWVPALVSWGQQHRSWKPGQANDPQPGDMVVFSGLHVGLVERQLPSGAITIIAGNTSLEQVARRGPAFPIQGTALGPAAISGYISPIAKPASAVAARALPRPTAAQMAAQDPQDHDARLAARERRALARQPALQHLPATLAGVRVALADRARDGRTVLLVTHRASRSRATSALRKLLARYHDPGHGYQIRHRRARHQPPKPAPRARAQHRDPAPT